MSKTIVFCLPGRNFSGEFLDSWTNTISDIPRMGYNYAISRHYSSVVYYARNLCLGADVLRGRHQKPFGGSVKYDYLMWIDSDIVWKTDHILQLVNRDVDIVSGLYKMENNIHYAAVKNWDKEFFQKYGVFQFLADSDITPDKNLIEVQYSGFGFMLIKYGVFESLEYPWFKPIYYDLGNDVYDFTAEDVGFCRTATEFGHKIYVDPNVIVKHQKLQLL